MFIRSMRLEDIPAVIQMAWNEPNFRVFEGEDGCFWDEMLLGNWIEADTDVLLVATIDEKVVGFILTTIHYPTGKVTLENQMVHPDHRKNRIGVELFLEMKRRLFQLQQQRARGLHLHLYVKKGNTDGLRFYESAGAEVGGDFTWITMMNL